MKVRPGVLIAKETLHLMFDPLPIFASEKIGIASNSGELGRYAAIQRGISLEHPC